MKDQDELNPDWVDFCKSKGFTPFPIDQHDIDLSTGLIESLMDALAHNAYDRSIPIIVAKSQDPNIDGEIVDGRHRIVAAYRLAKKRIAFKFPRIEQEIIPDIATLNCKIAEAVQKSRSKDPALAKRIVERRLKAVIESKIDQYGDKLPDKIVKMGFGSVTPPAEEQEEERENEV